MKKILLSSLIAAAAAVPAVAGVNNINYQAVIKDGNGVMADKKVEMKFELLNKDQVVYTEEQTPTTNAAGLVVCQLGKDDELSTIEWGDLTLRVSIKLGANYEVISNEAISSVPTALYALKTADSDMLMEEVENLVAANEETKATLLGYGAEIARIDGLATDFENLDENLTNSFTVVNTEIEDIKGQLENLNNVSAVVRANEDAIEELNTNTDAAFTMTETRFDKIQNQLDATDKNIEEEIVPAIEELVAANEETKATLIGYGAEIARIDGLATDFENLSENLDNLTTEMTAKFDEVNGQLENLNQVAAVTRANEEAIEELNTNLDTAFSGVETRFDKIQKQADATDADLENIKENLTNSLTSVNTDIEDINKQIENLNQVSAVVRSNEEAIEALQEEVKTLAPEGIMEIKEEVVKLNEANEETTSTLHSMSADIARIDGITADFENLGENLDNLTTEMTAKFDEVNGQLENLNQVAAVTRANEEKLEQLVEEELPTSFQMMTDLIEKLQRQVEALEAEVEALKK